MNFIWFSIRWGFLFRVEQDGTFLTPISRGDFDTVDSSYWIRRESNNKMAVRIIPVICVD